MSETIRQGLSQAWRWRVVLFKGVNGYFQVVTASLCAASCFSPKTTAVLLALVAGSKSIELFINQDLAKMDKSDSEKAQ